MKPGRRRWVGVVVSVALGCGGLGLVGVVATVAAASPGPDAVVAVAMSAAGGGWDVTASGAVQAFGGARMYGSPAGTALNEPIVGMAATPDGHGYWLVASDGGIFTYGDAPFYGSAGAIHLNKPIVAMAATPNGHGYWLVASDGGIFTYGNAPFYGSAGAIHLNKPIVGMAATPNGHGYWLVASDGGIFTYGNAPFYGSAGAIHLNKPIVAMAATPNGHGYWLVASDGGIFTYGNAPFYGSMGATPGAVVAGVGNDGDGYVMVTSSGTTLAYRPGASGPTVLSSPTAADPLAGDRFFVVAGNDAQVAAAADHNPADDAALDRIAVQPTAIWLGPWYPDAQLTVNEDETAARQAGQVPVFVVYGIPYRDCGGYSAGGFASDAAYEAFVSQVSAGIAGRPAVVIVEPDALPMASTCLDAAEMAERVSLIDFDSRMLSVPGTDVYLDAGEWRTPSYMAGILIQAGVADDEGFSINVAGYNTTAASQAYGDQLAAALAADGVPDKHYVVDTSRNGNGLAANPPGSWCNLPGAALGNAPSAVTSDPLDDAYLWVKYPGESDGSCVGAGTPDAAAPASGVFWPAYAIGLATGDA